MTPEQNEAVQAEIHRRIAPMLSKRQQGTVMHEVRAALGACEDEVWTTRDGRRIPIDRMTEEHAKNTLRMILRNRRRLAALKAALVSLSVTFDEIEADDGKWGKD